MEKEEDDEEDLDMDALRAAALSKSKNCFKKFVS